MCAAAFVALLAFVQYRMTREPSLPVIGVALLCAGAMDAFHTLAADRLITTVADNRDLIPFTWALCRTFNAIILVVGVGLFAFTKWSWNIRKSNWLIAGISLSFMVVAYSTITLCASSRTLPQTMFPDSAIKRPYDIYPLIPFLICGVWIFPKYLRQRRSVFAWSLLLSLIPQIATQLYMAFGSYQLHDSCFNIAHGLKAVSYLVPAWGLLTEYNRAFNETHNARIKLARNVVSEQLVGRAAQAMADATSFEDALQRCVDMVCDTTAWPIGHAYILSDDDTGKLVPTTIFHLADPSRFEHFATSAMATGYSAGIDLPGRVLQECKPLSIEDVLQHQGFLRADLCQEIGVQGAFAFPIVAEIKSSPSWSFSVTRTYPSTTV